MENINIELLLPHPHNPRENVGDVTELADSIRTNGIMQNLTVNNNGDNTYTVIIGHRRLAAAKLAGLDVVPCNVVVMDPATQQSTMLLENMQRTDLTPYEQAQGFQMCLDFGMSEDDLKLKTGFSKKTINHRLKLLALDKYKFKKGIDRGATLQDYIDLEQIKDAAKKDELLSAIGTNDYRYKLNAELNLQRNNEATQKFVEKLEEVMERVEARPEGYKYSSYLYGTRMFENYKFPDDINERKYVFCLSRGGAVEISAEVLEGETTAKAPKEPEQPTQTDLNVEEIKKKAKVAYETRLEFVKEIYKNFDNNSKKNFEIKYAFDLISGNIDPFNCRKSTVFDKVTGLELNDFKQGECESLRLLFALIYAELESEDDDITVIYWNYSDEYGAYSDNDKDEISTLYDFLELYGYTPSQEEREIMFGTHPLYVKNEEGE